jgi:hypothetical protein
MHNTILLFVTYLAKGLPKIPSKQSNGFVKQQNKDMAKHNTILELVMAMVKVFQKIRKKRLNGFARRRNREMKKQLRHYIN